MSSLDKSYGLKPCCVEYRKKKKYLFTSLSKTQIGLLFENFQFYLINKQKMSTIPSTPYILLYVFIL